MKLYVQHRHGEFIVMAASPVQAVVSLWQLRARQFRPAWEQGGLQFVDVERLGLQPFYYVHPGIRALGRTVGIAEVVPLLDPADIEFYVNVLVAVHGIETIAAIEV